MLGYTALASAAVGLPVGIFLTLGSTRVGTLAGRIGPKPFLVAGPALMGLGLLWLARIPADSAPWLLEIGGKHRPMPPRDVWIDVLPTSILFAIGLTLVVAPLTTALMASVPVRNAGVGSAINNAISRVGQPLILALLFIPITAVFTSELANNDPYLDFSDPVIRAGVQPLNPPTATDQPHRHLRRQRGLDPRVPPRDARRRRPAVRRRRGQRRGPAGRPGGARRYEAEDAPEGDAGHGVTRPWADPRPAAWPGCYHGLTSQGVVSHAPSVRATAAATSSIDDAFAAVGLRAPQGFGGLLRDALRLVVTEPPVADPTSELTETELTELRAAGLRTVVPADAYAQAVSRTAARMAAILADAGTVEETAKTLGVSATRVRQLLGERALFGVRTADGWLVPRFQLHGEAPLPGLRAVVGAAPAGPPPGRLPYLVHDAHRDAAPGR